jgi:hypothetical protein
VRWLFCVVLVPGSRPVTKVRTIFEPRGLAGSSSVLQHIRQEPHPYFSSALRKRRGIKSAKLTKRSLGV